MAGPRLRWRDHLVFEQATSGGGNKNDGEGRGVWFFWLVVDVQRLMMYLWKQASLSNKLSPVLGCRELALPWTCLCSVAFCSPAKSLTFSDLMEQPLN